MIGDYRITRLAALLVLDRLELKASLSAGGAPTKLLSVIDSRAVPDWTTILQSESFAPQAVTAVVPIEIAVLQTDYGMNEIPQATCVVETGRDLALTAAGAPDLLSASVTTIIERYLRFRVKARIYYWSNRTAGQSYDDDNSDPLPDGSGGETQVLFDGYLLSTSRRGGPGEYDLVFHLGHFLGVLGESSCLTPDLASGSLSGMSFKPGVGVQLISEAFKDSYNGPLIPSLFGAIQLGLGGSLVPSTDFWGYFAPLPSDTTSEESTTNTTVGPNGPARSGLFGVKGLAWVMASGNLFNWYALQTVTDASACTKTVAGLSNSAAKEALSRIEPLWSSSEATVSTANENLGTTTRYFVENLAANETITRASYTGFDINAYAGAGYSYGVPIAMRFLHNLTINTDIATGFASDLATASVQTHAPDSLWNKFINTHLPTYGLAICPMSTRAIVIPFSPTLNRPWQTIAASEYFGFDIKGDSPANVRGALLINYATNLTGAGGGFIQQPGDVPPDALQAVYDSCQPGMFIVRRAPAWLSNLVTPWSTAASVALSAEGRPMASAPSTAEGSDPDNARGIGGLALRVFRNFKLSTTAAASTGVALAKSVYQQERLRPRAAHIVGRFRTDIGPGSVVSVEIPQDRWAAAGLNIPTGYIAGIVTRVSCTIDCKSEPQSAITALQLGFMRQEGDLVAGNNDLSANGHPYWATTVYGCPLVDSFSFRAKLGLRDSLVT